LPHRVIGQVMLVRLGGRGRLRQAFVIKALIPHRDLRRLTAVRALCPDPPILVQGSADAECVSGAIAVPPPPGGLDPVGAWDAGERVRHPDVTGDWAENESVLRMEPLRAGHDLSLVEVDDGGDLGCCRRSSQLGEAPVGQVTQCKVILIPPRSGSLEWPVVPRPRLPGLPGLDARYPGPAPVA
jgi:hypothetical protein